MDHHDSHHHHHQILSGAVVSRRESDRETVFVEGSRTCRSFNALNLITVITTVIITVIIVVILIVVMIKHADHDHHYFGHLALVDQEKQVVQGSPTQRFELAIRTCDVKNNT